MATKQQVDSAEGVARRLVEEMGGFDTSLSGLTRMVRRFSAIEFEVPELPDADGYLFQYGEVNWFPEPTFALSIVRQLEVVDAAGEHESYVQVQFELRYPLDGDLDSVGSHSEWWFPGGEVSFDIWLDSVDRAEISNLLASKSPRDFVIWQELV
ncbi:hypothetical protein [Streptomyces antarcticus]|uniref:hypothetical protein n=1 Tax=Streptomyces antarcticus TaxID=2996458 RepID=UPI002272137A|nr:MULTISPECIES: hypothetical protein [unclassified Streptomyces]MCY0944081.1 hypothetical protein [Streptomyces sp. H34-AA3]MCZ4082219.1 hypothetical protein [Streptomyces sp. H34-S5]